MGLGGKVAHFIVATVHQKVAVLCEQYEGKTNGGMFLYVIKTHFQEAFSECRIPKGQSFLKMDVLLETVKMKASFGYSWNKQV